MRSDDRRRRADRHDQGRGVRVDGDDRHAPGLTPACQDGAVRCRGDGRPFSLGVLHSPCELWGGSGHFPPFVISALAPMAFVALAARRSVEHTSELQSLMRISYAVFSLIK